MARAVVPLNFNASLEKAKLKDDGSNAQKNYVLEAPLGARPAADATDDVKNVCQSKADDYSIVQCAMLYGLASGLHRHFEHHGAYDMLQELKLIFQANAWIERISSTAAKWWRIVLLVSIYLECLGTTIT